MNDTALTRSIKYNAALVNFIVPEDDDHLKFDAMYQSLSTYSYKSDGDKEEDTLSIWVPGVEVYYNFDDNTDIVDTDLTGEYVDQLENDGVDFVLQYDNTIEPYDMVIRGKSIAFSAVSTDDEETLMYARMKDGTIVDHVLTDNDGIVALYTTEYTTSDGELYDIQWYYGNTDLTNDNTTDNGPLATFDLDSNVIRVSTANVYGLLNEREIHVNYVWVSTDNPTDVTTPDDDTIKSHTAYDSTPQDETEQGYIHLMVGI
ncbi:MAG: hypothetical protein LUF02_05340 [Erysipelotrichaceae bacterium]|nr:hypothetical protein [Erysipelotrichaceae bacterium]